MMYRFLFMAYAGGGAQGTDHRHFDNDELAIDEARRLLYAKPFSYAVVIYRFAGEDTCGPMSYVTSCTK